jgi:predicted nucleotidyltransferase
MTEEIRLISDQIAQNRASLGDIGLYAFGSATHTNSIPNDIDILVIYHYPDQPRLLRKLLENLLYIEIDLIFMTPEEEGEMDFIKSQNCISID